MAFEQIDHSKTRTLGIISVSAAALLYKAALFSDVERFAARALGIEALPEFARFQLRQILQDCWIEQDKLSASVEFVPGQAQISIRGGQVIYGGAPLDLIVDKIKGIQSIFYRTIEYMRGDPLRMRGEPHRDITQYCKPWLFQAPPGSYQFSVAVQRPKQVHMFRPDLDPVDVVSKFLGIIRAGATDDADRLDDLVPEMDYRAAFLKLSRNLTPSGKLFDVMEIRASGEDQSVLLNRETRVLLNKRIKEISDGDGVSGKSPEILSGVLRALHLDKNWIEISNESGNTKIYETGDALEDVVGPMVNHDVRVTVVKKGRKYMFMDIEADEESYAG